MARKPPKVHGTRRVWDHHRNDWMYQIATPGPRQGQQCWSTDTAERWVEQNRRAVPTQIFIIEGRPSAQPAYVGQGLSPEERMTLAYALKDKLVSQGIEPELAFTSALLHYGLLQPA